MGKRKLEAGLALEPVPVVLVSTLNAGSYPNISTIAWIGVACSIPPMISLAIRPERYTYELIKEEKEFVVNIPSENMVFAADFCGTKSGRGVDKFVGAGLTPGTSSKINAPLILECPINIECVLKHTLELGSHTLFIGEIVAVQADEEVLDNSGKLSTSKVKPLAYVSPHEYWSLGKKLN